MVGAWDGAVLVISIHAPARGATIDIYIVAFNIIDFNPRSREGSDNICFCRLLFCF